MKHNKWVKRFEKEFGTQKQWMSTPATTPYARRSQLDFYRGLKHFISSLLKEQREEVEERMEGLMGKEHAKEMGDNLEMLYGQRQCVICGTNPEKQRELVLSILKGNKKL